MKSGPSKLKTQLHRNNSRKNARQQCETAAARCVTTKTDALMHAAVHKMDNHFVHFTNCTVADKQGLRRRAKIARAIGLAAAADDFM